MKLHRNQAEFVDIAPETLRCLCQYGRLGDMEAMMFFSFRNKAGDVVSYR